MSVNLKLQNNSPRSSSGLDPSTKIKYVEPFSPKSFSREKLGELHTNNDTKAEIAEAKGLASIGLWGLGIGLLAVIFACKRFIPFVNSKLHRER